MATPRRTSQRITLLMLVLASITVLTLDYHGEVSRGISHVQSGTREVISPFQRAIAAVLHPIGDVFAGAVNYGTLEEQNQRLRYSVGALQRTIVANDEATAIAREADTLDHLSYLAGISSTLAEVLSAPTSNFADTIWLDKGTADGVGKGMPVVAGRGLVGTVVSASAHSSVVQLVTDPSSKIFVRVAGSSAVWTATGTGHDRPVSVRYTVAPSSATRVRRGSLVTTSGLRAQGAYPAGIPIATVRSVHTGINETLVATPVVNLDNLQYVSVLDWLAPA